MFGNRAKQRARRVGVRTRTGAGFTPMPAGLGFRKSHSVGRLIITDVGHGVGESAGSGSQVSNGPRPGCRGERATITLAGRPCRQKRDSINARVSTIGRITITTSARINIVLLRQENSAPSEPSPLS